MMNSDSRSSRPVLLALVTAGAVLIELAGCSSSDGDSNGAASGGDASVEVVGARVERPANPKVAAVRMEIVNGTGRDDTLTAVSSPDGDASLHRSMTDDQAMASMDPLDDLEIPTGETVELAPGGLHIMLTDPTTSLEIGDTIELDLTFERAGTQTLTVPVVEIGTTTNEVEDDS